MTDLLWTDQLILTKQRITEGGECGLQGRRSACHSQLCTHSSATGRTGFMSQGLSFNIHRDKNAECQFADWTK